MVVAMETLNLEKLEKWETRARESEASAFFVFMDEHEAVVGPVIRKGMGGCLPCWVDSYYRGRTQTRTIVQYSREVVEIVPSEWLNAATVEIIASLAALRIVELMQSDRTDRQIYVWNADTLESCEYNFMPDLACHRCGELPYDSPELAIVKICSRPKRNGRYDRLRDVKDLGAMVRAKFVGPGRIASGTKNEPWVTSCAVAITEIPLKTFDKLEPCVGFAPDYDTARTVSVLEALERYAGAWPRNRRVSVRGCAASLGDIAIDPTPFGLYSQEQYAKNADIIAPYDPTRDLEFVWAYSFQRNTSVLMPRDLGFYSFVEPGRPVLAIEGSNGAALGSSAEEAILHGLFEVIERDSFLLTWYTRRASKNVRLDGSDDVEVRAYHDALQRRGFKIIIRDVTTEWGVPALGAIAYHEKPAPATPHIVCAAGAHINAKIALKKAMRELIASVDRLSGELADSNTRRRAEQLADDYTLVRDIYDHPLCYCVPHRNHDIHFLLDDAPTEELDECVEPGRRFMSDDIGEELRTLVKNILDYDADIVVVDHTTALHVQEGLHVYKTFIRGAVPIAFGYHMSRLIGLPRISLALVASGWKSDNGVRELNSAPHPLT